MLSPGDSGRAAGLGRAIVLGLALALAPGAGAAQQQQQQPGTVQSPVLTLNQEKLYQSTLFGQRMQRELNDARTELIAENRRIQRELEAEEAQLTEQRATTKPAEFRVLADAFDEKVTRIRAEQEGKTRALQRRQERAQQAFFKAIAPVVQEVVQASGAYVVLDQRAILVASEQIDVTDEVRARVDALVGDGASLGPVPDEPADTQGDGTPTLGEPIPADQGEPVPDPAPGAGDN